MTTHEFPRADPDDAEAPQGRNALAVIGAAAAASILILILAVTLFGDADDGEPRQIIRIAGEPRTGGQVANGEIGAPAPGTAASLVAANGILITDPALTEPTSEGPLPAIASDGRKPMDVYARPVDLSDARPKIAVVVGGLGIGEAVTRAAVDKLPGAITLAFTPQGTALQSWVSAARAGGHEVLLELPMEPFDYPNNDPGINTLMTGLSAAENPSRLRWLMTRMTGYAGVINAQGGKFLTANAELKFVLSDAKSRGLYMVDNGQSERSIATDIAAEIGAPFVRADRHIDRAPTREDIDRELGELITLAQGRGSAIGTASAFPITVDRIALWAPTLEQKGIALVPVSAILAQKDAGPPALAPALPSLEVPAQPAPEPSLEPTLEPSFEPTTPP